MKRHLFRATAILCCILAVSGCLPYRTSSGGSIFGSGRNKVTTAATIALILGSVLGQYYNTTTRSALVGTWTYDEPAIQFESESLLKKAGGVAASQEISNQLSPYLEKMGFKSKKFTLELREDNTCSYTIGGKTFNGTYDFDDKNKKLALRTTLLPLPTAYLSIVDNQMAMTYDSGKFLSLVQALGMVSNQPSISAVSKLAGSYDGMKTGLAFKKVK